MFAGGRFAAGSDPGFLLVMIGKYGHVVPWGLQVARLGRHFLLRSRDVQRHDYRGI